MYLSLIIQEDPNLIERCTKEIIAAAIKLDAARMICYNQRTGDLNSTRTSKLSIYCY
jgi:hypothetical protein